ncbi:hypothetical protein FSP39_006655 [Pinctada imbricata]|uniref:Uncharacterized protein n=1 Tax=Pinctada imbricata TaxID=66713 RepID=A0AA89BIX8_PINIB|nr:hypothetical protein FSP39_006655 [Pinctada imbricata]
MLEKFIANQILYMFKGKCCVIILEQKSSGILSGSELETVRHLLVKYPQEIASNPALFVNSVLVYTNVIYLRLCHIITFRNYRSSEVVPCGFRRYLVETESFRNCVNLIRADVYHMNLEGEDPQAHRPLLFVQSKEYSYTLDQTQLARWFSPYGTVDVKLQSRYSALVATGNTYGSKDIRRAFQKHKNIRVFKYNAWKHSPLIRPLLV